MTNTPTPAVLVDVSGVERWCTRDIATHDGGGKSIGGYVYAYCDFLSGIRYAPAKCREIRDGLVRVAVEEVAV